MTRRRWLALLVALSVLALAVGLVRRQAGSGPATVTVMTRNLYLGADITRPVRAARDRTGPDALLALGHAAAELRQVVDRTDFSTRSRLLAAEVAAARPDLVGLQEVARWRSGPLQPDHPGRLDATTVDVDFLPVLLGDLAAAGTPYDVVVEQPESDVEAPAFAGPLTARTAGEDVRLTLRDALLVRRGSGVRVVGSGSAQFRARLAVDLGGVPFAFVRGYVWADVAVGDRRLRVLSTQLESQSADVALAQARELLAGPAADPGRATVVVGDLNSDPGAAAVAAGETVPASAAYAAVTAAGFGDAWLQAGEREGRGPTAGLGELLQDPDADFDQRLDLVLTRAGGGTSVQAARASLTGDEPTDRDPGTGLWPSDHAGLVVRLRVG